MTNPKFVAALLLLFFSLNAGKEDDQEPIQIDRESLVKFSYTKICREEYMHRFDRLVFIKAFVLYEENQHLLLTPFQNTLKGNLIAYRKYVKEFLDNIDQELNNLELLPPLYIETKFNVLLRKAYTIMGKPEFVPPIKEATHEHPNLQKTLQDIEGELSIQTFTAKYLEGSKEQLKNHWQVQPFTESTHYFIETLPNALISILDYVRGNYDSTDVSEDMQYLIDFFNVFGRLIEENRYQNFILKYLTSHLGQAPKFQDEEHPDIFKNPEIFKLKNIQHPPYKRIATVDHAFHHPNDELYNIQNVLALLDPPYVYHPNWLEFFRYEGRDIPIKNTNNDEDERQRVIDEGFKNIYYVYVHARERDMIPAELNEDIQKIADILYDFIIDTDCYSNPQKNCKLSDLIPHQTFNRNYIVMLTLLKPFTSRPDDFDEIDIPKIVSTAKQLGIVNLNKNVPGLKIELPDFNKKISRQRMNDFEEDLKQIAKPILQANKDQPNSHVRKALAKEIKRNPGIVEESLVNYFPTISKTPENLDDIKDLFDDIDVIIDKAYEDEEAVSQVLIPVIRNKLPEVDFQTFDVDSLDESDKENFYTQLERSFKILEQIRKWTFTKIIDHPDVTVENPFFRYLSYTLAKNENINANEINSSYRKYAQRNEIRKRDIFVFYYLVKQKHDIDEGMDEESITEWASVLADKHSIDLEEFEMDEYFIHYKHSFEFMIPFFHLFSLFENANPKEPVDPKNLDDSDRTQYARHFDKLYQFLIDLRMNMEFKEEQPLKFAYQNLLKCMNLVRDHIITGSKIPDVDYASPENEEEELDETEQELSRLTYLKEYQPCKQNYSTMSSYYYFLIVEASSQHPEILQDHRKYFENGFAIKTEVLYEYANDSENWFNESFRAYCSKVEDQVCVGEEIFGKIKEFMKTANDSNDVREFFEEKFEAVETLTKHGSNMSPTIFWDVMHGINRISLKMTKSYDKIRNIMKPQRFVLRSGDSDKQTEFVLQRLASQHKDIFTKYIALKYYRRGVNHSETEKKMYSAVSYLLDNTENLIGELENNDLMTIAFCKFLVFYSKEYSQFEKVTNIMVQLKSIHDFLLWQDKNAVIKTEDFILVVSKNEPEAMAKQIAHVFKFKSVTPQPKPTVQTKTVAPAKKGALDANKKMLAARQAQMKKVADKVNQGEEQVIVGETTRITEITETIELESELEEVIQKAGVKPSVILTTKGVAPKQQIIKQIKKVSAMKDQNERRLRLLRRVVV